jgi:diaminopimelate decarboxylase
MMDLNRYLRYFSERETPFYFYDLELLDKTLSIVQDQIKGKPYHVHYALKANVNERLLTRIKDAGLGADCVSGNEVRRAVDAGFGSSDIVFAGVGKSDNEIKYALSQDIFSFNVESIEELVVLNDLAKAQNKTARFALRINPNVDAGTHEYITTGTRDNKFGVTISELWEALEMIDSLTHVEFIGIHFHIGSQITDLGRFIPLAEKVNELQKVLVNKGYELPHVNVGGGLGINYVSPHDEPIADFNTYFSLFDKHLDLLPNQQLHFELGRSIVAQCGSLVSRVLYTKKGEGTAFMILDAGMTELIRPALYRVSHHIESLTSEKQAEIYDVVGPICESSDAFGRGLSLPLSVRGDIIAIRSAGAYGEVMANRYNLRELPKAIYSSDLTN